MQGVRSEPRAAYIHVPFCRHRCGYCNFTLVADRDDLIESYLQAMEVELAWLKTPREVDTLFFGGGTPTHLSPTQLARLVSIVRRWFPGSNHCEVSMEANPSDVTTEKADLLAAHGVTRVSLGVQSFASEKLQLLERDHRAEAATQSVRICQERFASVACDLIFGVPGESLRAWLEDVACLVSLDVHHVSTYGLTFEKGTSFWSRRQRDELQTVDEETDRAMYLEAIDKLTSAEYEHYEVSNFAQPQHRCRHNMVYWRGDPYYAAGPGAASYLDGVRRINHRSTTTYLKRVLAGESPIAETETLGSKDRALERLVFALRMMEGIDCKRFQEVCGWEVEELAGAAIAELTSLGMLDVSAARLCLTHRGLIVSDAVFAKLLG